MPHDVNLLENKKEWILNKIAEGIAHGLNAREITALLGKRTTKAELVACIWYLLEHTNKE